MFADQELACGFHVLFVERTEDPAGSAGKNRRTNRLIDDPVFISPTASGKPRMEFVRDDFRPANRTFRRQIRIQAANPRNLLTVGSRI